MLNWNEIERRLLNSAERAMEVAGRQMETRAINLAPVRKVFQYQKDITKAPAVKAHWRPGGAGGGANVMAHAEAAPFSPNTRIRNRRTPVREDTAYPQTLRRVGGRSRSGALGAAGTNASSRMLENRMVVHHLEGGKGQTREHVHASEFHVDREGRPSYVRSPQMLPHYGDRGHERFSLENSAGQVLNTRGNYELRSGRALYEHPSGKGVTLGGRLRASIQLDTEVQRRGKTMTLRLRAGGEDAYYAIYQELGTRHHAAHPFLRPALDEASKYYPKYVARAINGVGL